MSFVKLTVLIVLAIPVLARADVLGDLRVTLQHLQSDQTLRARVEIKIRRSSGESGNPKQSTGDSSLIVESGGHGLRMSWSAEQIKQSRQAAAEKRAHPDAPRSDVATLTALEADAALDLLDAAEPLRQTLEGAALLEDKPDTYKGNPAQLLVIQLDLRLEEGEESLEGVRRDSEAMAQQHWRADRDGPRPACALQQIFPELSDSRRASSRISDRRGTADRDSFATRQFRERPGP